MSIQKFDAILLGSPCPAENVAAFAQKLRDLGGRSGSRIAFLSCSPGASDLAEFDAQLSDGCDFAALVDLVGRLCSEAKTSNLADDSDAPVLPVFTPEDFGDQCAHEKDLMVEIIDLFFAECQTELPAMGEALALNDFEQLSRIAHTIKGSLASLHAPLARQRSQLLESAAKNRDYMLCSEILQAFERDLDQLNKHLAAFREACLSA